MAAFVGNDGKSDESATWPKSLLLNAAYAEAFSCVRCHEIPRSCRNNEDGLLLCSNCAKEDGSCSLNKAVQIMVNKLKTQCLTVTPGRNIATPEVEGGVQITSPVDEQPADASPLENCQWMGSIGEWEEHSKICAFVEVGCEECHSFECPRKELLKHHDECPEMSIPCPLSCGNAILRKNRSEHLRNECAESLLECTNDECKEEVKRKEFQHHVEQQCEERVVQCPFVEFGCTVTDIKAKTLGAHIKENQFDHISLKFDAITTKQNEKIAEQNTKMMAQEETILALRNELDAAKEKQNNDLRDTNDAFEKQSLRTHNEIAQQNEKTVEQNTKIIAQNAKMMALEEAILSLRNELDAAKEKQNNDVRDTNNAFEERSLRTQNEIAQQKEGIVALTNTVTTLATDLQTQTQTSSSLTNQLNGLKSKQSNDHKATIDRIQGMEENKEEPLWCNAVYWSHDTGLLTSGGERTYLEIVLPQKAGKYLVSYSCEAYTNSQNYWIYCYFRFGGRDLNYKGGWYLHENHQGQYGVPVAGSAVVELNGNEDSNGRTLKLVHTPSNGSYPSGVRHCCLQCFELSRQ